MRSSILIALALCACNPNVNANTANAYFQDQMACVDAGGTRAQIDACRATVKAKYSSLLDGGDE